MEAERESSLVRVQATRWEGGRADGVEEELAREEPLEIRVRGRAITVTMRTPGRMDADGVSAEDRELAAGFLVTEGVVRERGEIEGIEACARNEWGNVVNVRLGPLVHVDFERLTRNVYAASSCGVCGKGSIEAVRGACRRVERGMRVRAEELVRMVERMRGEQRTFARTGGLHAAGLFRADGEMVVVREDIGRHNATDKVIGHAVLAARRLDDVALVVSGRVSFEIVQKASAAGIGVVAGVSAPSSLAVELGRDAGVAVVGFVREGRCTVYCGEERVVMT